MYTKILIAVITMNFSFVMSTPTFNCKLPVGCEINDVQFIVDYSRYEKSTIKYPGILCDIRNQTYQFEYPMPSPLLQHTDWCHISSNFKTTNDIMEFRFYSSYILNKQFNFNKMFNYIWYFKYDVDINFMNLNGFELDFANEQNEFSQKLAADFFRFQCIKCKIEFYSNGRHIKKCEDILDSNNDFIRSLFQIQSLVQRFDSEYILTIIHSEFKTPLCPLLFKNSDIYNFNLIGLTDTFYKRNILSVENRTFDDLNSTIYYMSIDNAEKISIDSNLLNPSVFKNLKVILFSGSFNKIDGNSLNVLKELHQIMILKQDYRDIIHKNGIKWIRDLNAHLAVNLSNFEELKYYYGYYKTEIQIGNFETKTEREISLSTLFPDKDFCLYKDFPFNQLVILMEYVDYYKIFRSLDSNRHYTCSYLWLAQYFHLYIKLDK